MLLEKKPTILITDYEIGNGKGFEFADLHETLHDDFARISMITSKTKSTGAIAEAAEGQVDGFLLKPFSIEIFRNYFLEIISKKMDPSPYLKLLKAGKLHRNNSEFDKAQQSFEMAKKANPKPALACYQLGELFKMQGQGDLALKQYHEGRTLVPLHIKCFIAEFEFHFAAGNFSQASEMVSDIRTRFPLNAERLIQLFKTVVEVQAYPQLKELYESYRLMDDRTPELIHMAELSFYKAGQDTLASGNVAACLEYFDVGHQLAGRSFSYLENVVDEMLKKNQQTAAEIFLEKALPVDLGSPAFQRLSFRVNRPKLSNEMIIKQGRDLVFAGNATPEIFQIVVQGLAEAGKETLAETTIHKAVEVYPELRPILYKVLADHMPKSAAS